MAHFVLLIGWQRIMSEISEVYSPFCGLKQSPLVFESPSLFTKLPNFGVYSIMYNPSKPKDYKPQELHFAEKSSVPVSPRQIEYMWNSAVPLAWRMLTPRPFLNMKDKKRDTLQFLIETQKYIHKIRKPQIIEEAATDFETHKSAEILRPLKTARAKITRTVSQQSLSKPTRVFTAGKKQTHRVIQSVSVDMLKQISARRSVERKSQSTVIEGKRRESEKCRTERVAMHAPVRVSTTKERASTGRCGPRKATSKVDTWRRPKPALSIPISFSEYMQLDPSQFTVSMRASK